jgi:S1-C subfamily serine protease
MKRFVVAVLLMVALATQSFAGDPGVVAKLQDISVTIKSGEGQGSGTIFNRKVGNDVVSYVWTAAHVVDNLRKVRSVVVNGSPKVVVEFDDAQIVQEFKQDGRRIGELKMEARVVRYSDAEQGEDLALLQVRKKNFVPYETSAKFYLAEEIPAIGTPLCHVGSLLGQVGANSYTEGVVSQIGRVLDLGANGVVFDQTTVTAFPGSSGGGVYSRDGIYVGMLVRGAGEQFNLIVPIRRMKTWAKAAEVEWALDDKIKMPSDSDLKALPVEDAGVQFTPESCPTTKGFPVLLKKPSSYIDLIKLN